MNSTKWKIRFVPHETVNKTPQAEHRGATSPAQRRSSASSPIFQLTTPIQDATMVSVYNTTIYSDDKGNSENTRLVVDSNTSNNRKSIKPDAQETPKSCRGTPRVGQETRKSCRGTSQTGQETPKSCPRYAKNQSNFAANQSQTPKEENAPDKTRRRTSVVRKRQ